ncbi:MAG: M48 family metalloprotease, partial [Bifidobacteriaceae bacterium]|nr:M48 family metalloprotease [Bifidobacteriaceae bacterium]
LIQMAISRTREYDADEDGSRLTGDPEALASALRKIEYSVDDMPMRRTSATQSTSALMISSPFNAKDMAQLFSTHPPTEERVKRLLDMAQQMREIH